MQPIRRYIGGIDDVSRDMTSDEVERLLDSKAGKGDWFANWLSVTPPADRHTTFRALLDSLPKGSYKPFAIVDGLPIKYDHKNLDNPLNSVGRHLRFVIIALPDSQYNLSNAFSERTLCIVGSSNPDGKESFLQCLSWDPHALGKGLGLTRFFQRSSKDGWPYFGDGFDAFVPASAPFGPFDGHVGGAMIMKELGEPWTHWFATKNGDEFQASLGSTPEKGTPVDPHNALFDKLFTAPGQVPFSLVGSAEDLEPIVQNSIRKWYISRFAHDFQKPGTSEPLDTISSSIRN
ncbi:hypothetical protein RhiJN_05717 [Ceratobasidium sp. AG-Ba]|nr:hypothetical protein RhiJN_05717 [Ceratobasidium sp. AG-Ba]QRW06647.1 hypothetical protein RhiLY_05646 [Ceratobasidium sp. AG-Ba]